MTVFFLTKKFNYLGKYSFEYANIFHFKGLTAGHKVSPTSLFSVFVQEVSTSHLCKVYCHKSCL